MKVVPFPKELPEALKDRPLHFVKLEGVELELVTMLCKTDPEFNHWYRCCPIGELEHTCAGKSFCNADYFFDYPLVPDGRLGAKPVEQLLREYRVAFGMLGYIVHTTTVKEHIRWYSMLLAAKEYNQSNTMEELIELRNSNNLKRSGLLCGELTDFALANAQFMDDDDYALRDAAEQRLEWLAIQVGDFKCQS